MKILLTSVISFYLSFLSLSQDGSLDPSFGTGGIVTTAIGSGDDVAYSVAIQSDGKIVVSGRSYNGFHNDCALVRYNTNGTLDATFGTGGIVSTPIGEDDGARSVAIQSDGKIVVGGWSYNNSNYDILLVRYNTNGTLDGTFGTGGVVTTPIGSGDDVIYSIVIQSDGKIVMGGYSDNGSNNDFAIVRYNTNGTLDGTFGTGGVVTTPIVNGDDIVYSVAIQSDSKIVVGGNSQDDSGSDIALVRYNTNGTLDETFGTGGIVTTLIGNSSTALSVAIQSDEKIVMGGYSDIADIGSNYDFAIVRYDTSGTLDGTFGTGGIVTTPIGSGDDFAYTVAIQSDGKIVASGPYDSGNNNDFALVRYRTDGTLDETFGTGGVVTTPIGSGDDVTYSVAIQSDWKIVLGGYSDNISHSNFALARYNVSILNVFFDGPMPLEYILAHNYPNPFNPTTTIKYQIPKLSFVILKVYDVLGNEITTLVNEEKLAGSYQIKFDATILSSGLYFYRLQAGDFVETKKMLMLK